jgi:hypothetical protein
MNWKYKIGDKVILLRTKEKRFDKYVGKECKVVFAGLCYSVGEPDVLYCQIQLPEEDFKINSKTHKYNLSCNVREEDLKLVKEN